MSLEVKKMLEDVVLFCKERNWDKFQNLKDEALCLALESSEVLEHFQWKKDSEIRAFSREKKEEIAKELVDVLYWVLLMSNSLDVDIEQTFAKKMAENAEKYPVEAFKLKDHENVDETSPFSVSKGERDRGLSPNFSREKDFEDRGFGGRGGDSFNRAPRRFNSEFRPRGTGGGSFNRDRDRGGRSFGGGFDRDRKPRFSDGMRSNFNSDYGVMSDSSGGSDFMRDDSSRGDRMNGDRRKSSFGRRSFDNKKRRFSDKNSEE